MMVRWTNTALGHLSAIHDYIARDSPVYAGGVVDRLTERSKQLARFPRSGRVVPEFEADDVRQVFEGTYRIVYRTLPERLDVPAVLHTALEFPGRFTPFEEES
jgi:toxin ParE1/3/4